MPIEYRRRDKLRGTEAEERIGIAIRGGFSKLGDFIVPSLKQRARKDRRRHERSINYKLSGRGLRTRMVIGAGSDHSEYVEKDRPAGGKAPPPDVLLAWVRRRGLGATNFSQKTGRAIAKGTRRTFNRKAGKRRTAAQSLLNNQKSIAYLIGRKIVRDGIKGQHHFETLRQDYASQISASRVRIEALVAQQLNS